MTGPAVLAVAASVIVLGAVAPPAWGQAPDHPVPTSTQLRIWHQILAAEDARVETPLERADLQTIIWSNDQLFARLALRALGRTENPSKCADVIPMLVSRDRDIRSAAAEAISRCYVKQPNFVVSGVLLGLVRAETDPVERASVAKSIGLLTYDFEPSLRAAEDTLVNLLAAALSAEARAGSEPGAPPSALTGLLAGLGRLERRHANLASPSPAAVETAGRVVRSRAGADWAAAAPDEDALARRLALQLLLTARAATPEVLDVALADPDDQVRRLAAIGVAREDPLRADALGRALRDPSGAVRYGALSQLGRREAGTFTVLCDIVLDRAQDDDSHVALLAIDLAARCVGSSRAAATLASDVDRWPVEGVRSAGARPRWHRAAHALVALATLAPDRARAAIARFAGDATWQVRMYAARAAAIAGEWGTLARLAHDPHDNVREAAIAAWSAKRAREADPAALEALARDDYQVLITAAKALEGTPRRQEARDALFGALDRVTRQQRETSRDARRAIIERVGELGEPGDANRLEPYLSDFDPAVASGAASLLGKWTGRPQIATPRLVPRLPLPTPDELSRLLDTRVVLHLRGLGEVELRMRAVDAPLNAFRFARLASGGYYDGLTFHRVAPGFVIQGGSPGANEYSGDGPFTRDEIGAPNRRGAVGLSTRGRDTGDAQFYVNLVDNDRLDEDYTVFAEVIRGMNLVDRVLEGDVIERVAVTRREEEEKE